MVKVLVLTNVFRSICTGAQIISTGCGKFVLALKYYSRFRADVTVMIQQACCELQQPAGRLAPNAPFCNFNVDTVDG